MHTNAAAISNNATVKYATFYIEDLFLGIDVLKVQEVLRYQEMTRVPRAPEGVRGLINLRGQIVTALDIRRRMGLRPSDTSRQPMNVLIRSSEGAVSLLVDEISDVVEVSKSDFEVPPQSLAAEKSELLEGLYKLNQRLLLILNTDRVLQS